MGGIVAESRRRGVFPSRAPGQLAMRTAPPTAAPSAALTIDVASGLLTGVRQVLSPNFDARPADTPPTLLVVHGISLPPGEFGGPWIDRLFTGTLPADGHPFFRDLATARLSAHALIRRDGLIVQYVPFGERAWHAGVSEYRGRSGCNDFCASEWSWKARVRHPTPTRSTSSSHRSRWRCSRPIPRCPPTASSDTPMSRPTARATPGRRSTGRGTVPCFK